ncbi:15594_t:CDS:2, partial [Gigaspora margarita]
NSTLLDPYRDLLLFNIVNKSLNELKVQFDQDVRDANVSDSYIYIDMKVNNVIIHPNSPPVFVSEGVFIRDEKVSYQLNEKTCLLGFYAHSKKRAPGHTPTKYIITARKLKKLGIMESNYTILYNFLVTQMTSFTLDISLAIRNSDDPRYPELFITNARPAIIHSGHICHSDLIITDMNTCNEDIG